MSRINDDNTKLRIILYLSSHDVTTQNHLMNNVLGVTGNWSRVSQILDELTICGWITKIFEKSSNPTFYKLTTKGKKIIKILKKLKTNCPELWELRSFKGISF